MNEPRVREIAGGVLVVTGLWFPGGAGVNAGVIPGRGGHVFIDAGMTARSGHFLLDTARSRIAPRDNLRLVLTHHHADHSFGMGALVASGAVLVAHRWAARMMTDEYRQHIAGRLDRFGHDGQEILKGVRLFRPGILADGDFCLDAGTCRIIALHTPGHTPGCLSVFHPPSRTLFAGDAVAPQWTPESTDDPERCMMWLRHLERIRALSPDVVVPGHGEPGTIEIIDRNMAELRALVRGC